MVLLQMRQRSGMNFYKRRASCPGRKTVMLLGLAVLPEYRGEGLARALMYRYLCRMVQKEKDMVLLTCLDSRVPMYEKWDFRIRELPILHGEAKNGMK